MLEDQYSSWKADIIDLWLFMNPGLLATSPRPHRRCRSPLAPGNARGVITLEVVPRSVVSQYGRSKETLVALSPSVELYPYRLFPPQALYAW